MTAQRTEKHTKVILDFLATFIAPSKTDDTRYYCKITDADAADRLNSLYAGSAMGGFFTTSKVQRARTEKWGASKPAVAVKQALLPTTAAKTPPPDAVGCFWERLDALQASIDALSKDLGEHRVNNAGILDDQTKVLNNVRNIVLAMHKEWTGSK